MNLSRISVVAGHNPLGNSGGQVLGGHGPLGYRRGTASQSYMTLVWASRSHTAVRPPISMAASVSVWVLQGEPRV